MLSELTDLYPDTSIFSYPHIQNWTRNDFSMKKHVVSSGINFIMKK